MAAKKVKGRDVTGYSGLSDINHVYAKPDSYIGPTTFMDREVIVLNPKTLKSKNIITQLPEGVERIALEILANAGDNADTSRRAGIDPEFIEMDMDNRIISVKNYGMAIDVKRVNIVEESNGNTKLTEYTEGFPKWEWLPTYIFGKIRTSDNYDQEDDNGNKKKKKKKTVVGKNGFGSKLANIFSTWFMLEIEDEKTQRRYRGVWRDNMHKDFGEPEIEVVEDETIQVGSVKVSWELDFDRFEMEGYSESDMQLFCQCLANFSFTCKVKTKFNGILLDYRNITDFGKLFYSDYELGNSFFEYCFEEDASKKIKNATPKLQEEMINESKDPNDIPILEVLVVDTPNRGFNMSFANGLFTRDQGVHVEAVEKQIFSKIISVVLADSKKGKLNKSHIRPHISFIVNVRVENPAHNSQSKTKLTGPPMSFSYKEKNLNLVKGWDLIGRLGDELAFMATTKASATDGMKKRYLNLGKGKGEDANFAGGKHSPRCVLYLVEGLSAANYPQLRLSMQDGGKDIYGYLPLRGKVLNVTKADSLDYAENKVISIIKQMIGLKEGVRYDKESNLKDLRYGNIVICVDADDDGMHILATLINFFREKFPGLLLNNRVSYLRTPIVRVRKGKNICERFFTVKMFEDWRKKMGPDKMKGKAIKYYKGLGSSDDVDIIDDLKIAPVIVCYFDNESEDNLNLAFHGDFSDMRKDWIENWRDVEQDEDDTATGVIELEGRKSQKISQLINRELVSYSVATLFRAIPNKYDVLKESQRKALWAALMYFNYNPKGSVSEIKTGRFANKAADMAQYHHGEKSLTDTVIKMTQTFTGSNNLNYYKPGGQFGTRADGGGNAADARYSSIHLEEWIPYVFKREYVDLVEKNIVDDEPCEPKWLPSVIPVGLTNGSLGVATGFSSAIPSFSPFDCIKWIKARLTGKEFKEMKPWFNGFTGKIIKTLNRHNSGTEELLDEGSPGQEDLARLESLRVSKYQYKTYGAFKIIGQHKSNGGGPIIEITELPAKRWFIDYYEWLKSLLLEKPEKRLIHGCIDHSTTSEPNYVIEWCSHTPPTYQNLKLITSFSTSNVTVIDNEGFPFRYKGIEPLLESYFENMYRHYELIQRSRISSEIQRQKDLRDKIKFVSLVVSGKIPINNTIEDNIRKSLEKHGVPFETFEKSKTRDMTKNSLQKHEKDLIESDRILNSIKGVSATSIWMDDLCKLEKFLKSKNKTGKITF
jgi:DNA topoisomerase II